MSTDKKLYRRAWLSYLTILFTMLKPQVRLMYLFTVDQGGPGSFSTQGFLCALEGNRSSPEWVFPVYLLTPSA